MEFTISKSKLFINSEDPTTNAASESARELYKDIGAREILTITGYELSANDKLAWVLNKFLHSFEDKVIVWEIGEQKISDMLSRRYVAEKLGFQDLTFAFDNGELSRWFVYGNAAGMEVIHAMQVYVLAMTSQDIMTEKYADLFIKNVLENPLMNKKLRKYLKKEDVVRKAKSF